jgi:hypothetical protein
MRRTALQQAHLSGSCGHVTTVIKVQRIALFGPCLRLTARFSNHLIAPGYATDLHHSATDRHRRTSRKRLTTTAQNKKIRNLEIDCQTFFSSKSTEST